MKENYQFDRTKLEKSNLYNRNRGGAGIGDTKF